MSGLRKKPMATPEKSATNAKKREEKKERQQLSEWIIDVPKDPAINLQYRYLLQKYAENDLKLQFLLKERCARPDGFEFYCDSFAWTYDPREAGEKCKPFVLWPEQRRFVNWLEDLYQRSQRGEKINIVVDKPRGIGISYLLMTWAGWHYIFHEFSARVGSRKEDYVDKKGDPDSLFYKIDYQLDRQPLWLVGEHNRAYMSVRPKNEILTKSISGESANPDFGRGGRRDVIIYDEFGFWSWATSSWESAGESTNLRIAVSTPPETGKDSHMYKLLTNQAGKVFIYNFDWTADPRRDDAWYIEAKNTKSEEEFAREVLKSYEGTTKGKVYAVSARRATIDNTIDYDPILPLFVSWDFGLDAVAMIWYQKDMATGWVRMIDCYENSDKEIDFYVPFITGRIESAQNAGEKYQYSEQELKIIERHAIWKKTITHYV